MNLHFPFSTCSDLMKSLDRAGAYAHLGAIFFILKDAGACATGMEFEVQEVDDDDKPAVEAKRPRKWLLEDPIHNGSALPGFHLAREPLKKKPWYIPTRVVYSVLVALALGINQVLRAFVVSSIDK